MGEREQFEAEAERYRRDKAQLEAQEARTVDAAYAVLAAGLLTKRQVQERFGISWPTLNRWLAPLEAERGALPVTSPNQYRR